MFDWLIRLWPFSKRTSDYRVVESVARQSLQAGRQTQPANALAGFGWSWIPRRAAHTADPAMIDVRRYSAQQMLDLLADVSPDTSLALWNVLRLAGGQYDLQAKTLDESEVDERAQTVLDELVGRINQRHGGLESLIDQWLYTLFLQGALAAELVISESLREIDDIIAVQPYAIQFKRDNEQVSRPYAQDKNSQWKALNENLFWYVPLDAPPDDPYGRAPAAPAIGEVMFGFQMMVDLKRALHTNAWGRLDVSVLYEMLANAAPQSIRGNADQLWTWVNARLTDIQSQYNSLEPDDTFVHLDLVKVDSIDSSGKMLQIAPLLRVMELRTIRALKQLPVLMGSNEGTTETHGTVQFEIYAAGIEALRNKIDWLIEQMLTQALNILGVQAVVAMEWDDLRTTDRLKDAQAEALEIENEANKVLHGWQTDEDAAMAITGHEPTGTASVESDDGEDKRLPSVRANLGEYAQSTPAERRVYQEMRRAVSRYFIRLRDVFPSEEIARAAVEAEEAVGARRADLEEDMTFVRVKRLVDEWFESHAGQGMTDELHELVEDYYLRAWNVEGAEALSRLGIGGSFQLRNQTVIDSLRAFGAERVTGMDAETKRKLASVIADSLNEGNGVDQIGRDIRRTFTDMSVRRARLVAHTEVGTAMGQASHETYRRNGVEDRFWLTTGDPNVCEICEENEAAGLVPINQPFPSGDYQPLAHPRCLLPGNEVIAPGVVAATRAWYDGPALELVTESGHKLAVTANHLILTPHGFLPAQALNVGDDVISGPSPQRIATAIDPNDQHRPAKIEQVWSALAVAPGVLSRLVPASTEDFYGEGRFVHGDINVIWADSLLLSDILDAALSEHIGEHAFGSGHLNQSLLDSFGVPYSYRHRQRLSANSVMRSGCVSPPFFGCHSLHSERVGLRRASRCDTLLQESPAQDAAIKPTFTSKGQLGFPSQVSGDDLFRNIMATGAPTQSLAVKCAMERSAAYPELAQQILQHLAGVVATDKIVEIRAFRYSGHVYDLQTVSAVYIGSGIIVKNCRCTERPHVPADWSPPDDPWRGG